MDTIAKLNTGFIITAIGMGVVFIVLILLSYTFNLMEVVFRGRVKMKAELKTAGASPVDTFNGSGEISGLVAVISAAVLSFMGSKSRFVVRSITRAGDSVPVWGKTGRHDQMISRMIK
jgi:sodium pump decarboxylase gamma subunit